MGEPKINIDVLFTGQTGVGKSSLINMIRGVEDDAPDAANVSNDARPCTAHTTSYQVQLGSGLHCRLWDTRGVDEAVENHDRRLMAKLVDRIRQLAPLQGCELKETIRDRTKTTVSILVWCIHATKINVPVHWQQFRKVYVEYCERRAIPMIVLTQTATSVTGWESKCRSQLEQLGLGIGANGMDMPLLRVREHHGASSAEYTEDAQALRDLIAGLVKPTDVDQSAV